MKIQIANLLLQYVVHPLALAAFILTIALSLFLKGVGMGVVWPHVLVLVAFTAAVMGIGLPRLRRSLA